MSDAASGLPSGEPAVTPSQRGITLTGRERASLISAVKTPLGFFALVVLVVEAILLVALGLSSGPDRTYLVIGMLVLVVGLVGIVTFMALFRPMSLYGRRDGSDEGDQADSSRLPSSFEREPVLVTTPRILVATALGHLADMHEEDYRIIRSAFQQYRRKQYKIAEIKMASPNDLTEALMNEQYDILQIGVTVTRAGDLQFGAGSSKLPSEGFARLLEHSGVKLVVLATCDSVGLAAHISRYTAMIAATGNLPQKGWTAWSRIFYSLLAKGAPLSDAYATAMANAPLPVAVISRTDLRIPS